MSVATHASKKETIDGYVTDMLALEKHIQTVLSGQIQDLDEHSEFKGALLRIHAVCDGHVNALEALTARRSESSSGVAKVVKKAVSSVLGLGAAAIDFVRTEKLPKDLRDDYTAISLAYIGYLMLHTTALTLNDSEVAMLARTYLREQAELMMALQQIIPAATVSFLASEGYDIDTSVLPEIAESVTASWR